MVIYDADDPTPIRRLCFLGKLSFTVSERLNEGMLLKRHCVRDGAGDIVKYMEGDLVKSRSHPC
jgi:hypothetical protein